MVESAIGITLLYATRPSCQQQVGLCRSVAQLVRALPRQGRGPRFEPERSYHLSITSQLQGVSTSASCDVLGAWMASVGDPLNRRSRLKKPVHDAYN